MRRTQIVTALCTCLTTMGLLAAVGATASAHEFTVSKTGAMKGANASNMVFKTKGGTITCTSVTVGGTAGGLKTEVLELPLKWAGCTAFGFVGAKTSSPFWDVNANESVTLGEAFVVETTGCVMTMIAQGPVKVIKFQNLSNGELLMEFNIAKLISKGEGAFCAYALEESGTLTGNFVDKVESGTLTWA